jgi:hypothetical protein
MLFSVANGFLHEMGRTPSRTDLAYFGPNTQCFVDQLRIPTVVGQSTRC